MGLDVMQHQLLPNALVVGVMSGSSTSEEMALEDGSIPTRQEHYMGKLLPLKLFKGKKK